MEKFRIFTLWVTILLLNSYGIHFQVIATATDLKTESIQPEFHNNSLSDYKTSSSNVKPIIINGAIRRGTFRTIKRVSSSVSGPFVDGTYVGKPNLFHYSSGSKKKDFKTLQEDQEYVSAEIISPTLPPLSFEFQDGKQPQHLETFDFKSKRQNRTELPLFNDNIEQALNNVAVTFPPIFTNTERENNETKVQNDLQMEDSVQLDTELKASRRWRPGKRKRLQNPAVRRAIEERRKSLLQLRYPSNQSEQEIPTAKGNSSESVAKLQAEGVDSKEGKSGIGYSFWSRKSRGTPEIRRERQEKLRRNHSKEIPARRRRIIASQSTGLTENAKSKLFSPRRSLGGVAEKVRPLILRNGSRGQSLFNPPESPGTIITTTQPVQTQQIHLQNSVPEDEYPSYDDLYDPAPSKPRYTPQPSRNPTPTVQRVEMKPLPRPINPHFPFGNQAEQIIHNPLNVKTKQTPFIQPPRPVQITLNTIPELKNVDTQGFHHSNAQQIPLLDVKSVHQSSTPITTENDFDYEELLNYDEYSEDYDNEGTTSTAAPNIFDQFSYGFKVAEKDTGNFQSRTEERDGKNVAGSYEVALPDGRIQTVAYVADDGGFRAEVTYKEDENIATTLQSVQSKLPIPDRQRPKFRQSSRGQSRLIVNHHTTIQPVAPNPNVDDRFDNFKTTPKSIFDVTTTNPISIISSPIITTQTSTLGPINAHMTPWPSLHTDKSRQNGKHFKGNSVVDHHFHTEQPNVDHRRNHEFHQQQSLVSTTDFPPHPNPVFEPRPFDKSLPPSSNPNTNELEDPQSDNLIPNPLRSTLSKPNPKPVPLPRHREVARIPPNPFTVKRHKTTHKPVKPEPKRVFTNPGPPIHPLLNPNLFNRPVLAGNSINDGVAKSFQPNPHSTQGHHDPFSHGRLPTINQGAGIQPIQIPNNFGFPSVGFPNQNQQVPQVQFINPHNRHVPQVQFFNPQNQQVELSQTQFFNPQNQQVPRVQFFNPQNQQVPQVQFINPQNQQIPQVQFINPHNQQVPQVQFFNPQNQQVSQLQFFNPQNQQVPQVQFINPQIQQVPRVQFINPNFAQTNVAGQFHGSRPVFPPAVIQPQQISFATVSPHSASQRGRRIKGSLDFQKNSHVTTPSPNPFKLVVEKTRASTYNPTLFRTFPPNTPVTDVDFQTFQTTTPFPNHLSNNVLSTPEPNFDYIDFNPLTGHVDLLRTTTPPPTITTVSSNFAHLPTTPASFHPATNSFDGHQTPSPIFIQYPTENVNQAPTVVYNPTNPAFIRAFGNNQGIPFFLPIRGSASETIEVKQKNEQDKPNNLQKNQNNLSEKTTNLQRTHVNLQEKTINIRRKQGNLHEKPINIQRKEGNLQEIPIDLRKTQVTLQDKSINLQRKVNLQEKPINLQRTQVNLQEKPTNLPRKQANLQDNPISLLWKQINFQHKPIEVQRKQINLPEKQNRKTFESLSETLLKFGKSDIYPEPIRKRNT